MINVEVLLNVLTRITVVGLLLSTGIFSYNSFAVEKKALIPCDSSSVATGKKYNVIGSGINVRNGPSTSYEKIINHTASKILNTTEYIQIDDTVTVYEDCTKNNWSRIKVVTPEWLAETHVGWVASKFLDKGAKATGDKYAGKIRTSALSPYTKRAYPNTVKTYGSRLKEVEKYRRKAAEMAVDSGKCDYVEMSELSEYGSLNHLLFWVDCRNKQRFYYDEFEIKKNKLK